MMQPVLKTGTLEAFTVENSNNVNVSRVAIADADLRLEAIRYVVMARTLVMMAIF